MRDSLVPETSSSKVTKPSPLEGFAKLAKDPEYLKLSPEAKAGVRGKLYDKYVVPYYKNKGVDLGPEQRDRFSKAGTGMPVASPQEETTTGDFFTHLAVQTGKQGIKVERGMDVAANRLGNVVQDIMGSPSSTGGRLGSKFNTWIHGATDESSHVLNRAEDQANAYLGSNYSDNLKVKAAELPIRAVGSTAATLVENPEYLAIPSATSLGVEGLLGKTAISEALLQGSTKAKLAYSAIKGAADGYLTGKYEEENNKEASHTALLFGGVEAGIVAAKPALKFLSTLNVWGGPKAVEQAIKGLDKVSPKALEQADSTKITTLLMRATSKMRDEVAQELGFNNYAEARAAKQQAKVAEGLSSLLKQANKEAAVHNPELVQLQAKEDVKEWLSNPLGAKLAAGLQKMGVDPVAAATTTTIKNAKIAAGDFSEIKAGISKDAMAAVSRILEGVGPGARSAKSEKDIFKAVTKLVKTNIPMESHDHTFTFMWGIRDQLPKEIQPTLIEGMKTIYGPKPARWDRAARELDTHMDKMIKAGHISPNDPRGVFRSTRPAGHKTVWQKQLDEEVKAIKAREQ